MSQEKKKKDVSGIIEIVVAIFMGILAIGTFVIQILTTTEKTTKLENALFNMLQFLLTVGFTWYTTRAISRDEFEKNLKKFAISAYRRIADIEKITNRLKVNVSQMTKLSAKDHNELMVIGAIVEDTRQIVKSSMDDWADVIGDELIALENIRRLEREKAELSTFTETLEEKTVNKEAIKKLEKQISMLRSMLPANLQVVSRNDDNYQELMTAKWLARQHEEANGFRIRVVTGGDYSDETDIEKINLSQDLFTRKTQNNALDIVDKSGNLLGRVLNPLPTEYDNSVKILERCYGTTDLKVQFVEILKKYTIRGRNFMHFTVRVLTSPISDIEEKTVFVTD